MLGYFRLGQHRSEQRDDRRASQRIRLARVALECGGFDRRYGLHDRGQRRLAVDRRVRDRSRDGSGNADAGRFDVQAVDRPARRRSFDSGSGSVARERRVRRNAERSGHRLAAVPGQLREHVDRGHVDLTDATYKNARVTWSQPVGIPSLASNDSKDATLLGDKTAHYTYTTVTRPPISADDCPKLVPDGSIGITITVERRDVSKVIDSLVQLIANKLPAKLQTFLQPYEQPAIDAAKAAVGNFKGPRASAAASVMEYVADPLCQHTPPPTTPTPQAAQTGKLSLAPCEAVLAMGNIGAAYPGAIILNNIPHNPELRKFLANQGLELLALARRSGVQTQGVENNPRIAGQSSCALGPPYVSPPDPAQDVAPPIEAMFVVLPADGTPVDTAKSNPECLAALGPELAYFKAECWIQHVRDHAGGPVNSTMIFVFTDDAEYVNEAMGPSDAGTVLMRSILQGLEHGPPTPPTPAPPPPTPRP